MNLKNNPEFIPLIEWWEKDGKSIVLYLVIAVLAVGGWKYYQHQTAASKVAASNAVVSAYTTEELENAVSQFGSKAAGGVLKLRLAKSYFDAGRYEESLAKYEELRANPPDGFADVVTIGAAYSLEGLKKFDEAQQAFDNFAGADANTNSYLKLTAQLGGARCLAQKGEDKTAFARLDALKKAYKDDEPALSRIADTEKLLQRMPASAPEI